MRQLKDTTLVCADCKNYSAALRSMSICASQIKFNEKIFFTDQIFSPFVVKIEKINSVQDYSRFIFKEMFKHIKTKYILVCQHDGFIINPSSWDDIFYRYDYIGAPWSHRKWRVGNGGFSFRSLKLHKILSQDRFSRVHPEDSAICTVYRSVLENEYQIKFAPYEVAEKFSIEGNIIRGSPFGFHGKNLLNHALKMPKNKSLKYIPLL